MFTSTKVAQFHRNIAAGLRTISVLVGSPSTLLKSAAPLHLLSVKFPSCKSCQGTREGLNSNEESLLADSRPVKSACPSHRLRVKLGPNLPPSAQIHPKYRPLSCTGHSSSPSDLEDLFGALSSSLQAFRLDEDEDSASYSRLKSPLAPVVSAEHPYHCRCP